jgi:CRP-like cAMP-binding protein
MKLRFFSYANPAEEIAPQGHAILDTLTEEDWSKLTPFMGRRQYEVGTDIIRAGERDRDLFILLSGAVRLVAAPGSDLAAARQEVFGEGAVIGLASFFDGLPRAAGAVAARPADVLRMSYDKFEQLAAWHPRIAILLMREFGSVLSQALRQHRLVL